MNNSECSYSFEHLQVIDSSTGTVVCGNCGLELEEGLSYEETKYRYHKEYVSDSDEKIDGEHVKVLLEKIGDSLHLSQSIIDIVYVKFLAINKDMTKTLSGRRFKQKKTLLSKMNLLVYSIHCVLKEESCPRSLREICFFSPGTNPQEIGTVEKFIEKNIKIGTSAKKLQPITPKDIILTHYLYIDGFTFNDVTQIFHRLNCLKTINFSALTIAAGSVYLYANQNKSSKLSVEQASTLFGVTTMSVYRFVKKYKNSF